MRSALRLVSSSAVLLALMAAPSRAADVTLTGVVSDAACGVNHHGREAAECVRSCVEESGQYALVVGSRVYTLVADEEARAALYELAGRTAIVTGDRESGDVVTVKSVKPLPSRR